jgi:hypothetical protein
MTSTAKGRTCPTPAARQKQVWDKAAPGYDKQIAFFEKTWFAGGREWLGERALGRVLEVAIGTGRNLPCYPADVTITGIELSPRCWQSAGSAPPTSAVTLTCAKATPSTCQSRTPHSTLAAIMKNRLKRIQYRPVLIDGFLAQTGLSIEPNHRRPRPWPFRLYMCVQNLCVKGFRGSLWRRVRPFGAVSLPLVLDPGPSSRPSVARRLAAPSSRSSGVLRLWQSDLAARWR